MYAWFDGTMTYTTIDTKFDASKGQIDINSFTGSYDDPNSRIYPFKKMKTYQPYDKGNNTLVYMELWGNTPSALWGNYDFGEAIEMGMKKYNLPYSGEWDFIETYSYWPINHMVSPKEDALSCNECHAKEGRYGGKMDPDNPMKLAIMFATDDVKYASQSGCWQSCHHDANDMPHNPGENVTKYIGESRTKMEVKGRRGKKRGGWDKRKSDADIAVELDAGRFMDIIRYKSGEKKTEDGHLLADRIIDGGKNTEFIAKLEGNIWVVEMTRKLNSGKTGDIKMELDKLYNFGFAIHDDHTNSRFHHVSLGYRLGFDNDKADVNASKQ